MKSPKIFKTTHERDFDKPVYVPSRNPNKEGTTLWASQFTYLHILIIKKDINNLNDALRINYDPNVQDGDGYTPLHWAVIQGYTSCAKSLLNCERTNIYIMNNKGQTAQELMEQYLSDDPEKKNQFQKLFNEHIQRKDLKKERYRMIYDNRQKILSEYEQTHRESWLWSNASDETETLLNKLRSPSNPAEETYKDVKAYYFKTNFFGSRSNLNTDLGKAITKVVGNVFSPKNK